MSSLPPNTFKQKDYLLIWCITVSRALSPYCLLRPAVRAGHDLNLQTRWPVDVALATGPRPQLLGDGSRLETLAGPCDHPEAWPRSGREAAAASSLGGRQDRLILILSNTARATGVRDPRGSLYNVIFWKHRCLKCFLAWNEWILCTAPPWVLLRFQAGGPSSALSSTEGLSAKGDSKGGAGPESSARSSRPPACEDAAAILNMSNSLVQLQVFARGSAHALVIYIAV